MVVVVGGREAVGAGHIALLTEGSVVATDGGGGGMAEGAEEGSRVAARESVR